MDSDHRNEPSPQPLLPPRASLRTTAPLFPCRPEWMPLNIPAQLCRIAPLVPTSKAFSCRMCSQQYVPLARQLLHTKNLGSLHTIETLFHLICYEPRFRIPSRPLASPICYWVSSPVCLVWRRHTGGRQTLTISNDLMDTLDSG